MKLKRPWKFEGGPAMFYREFAYRYFRARKKLIAAGYEIGDAATFSANGGDEFGMFCHANKARIQIALQRMVETCVEP